MAFSPGARLGPYEVLALIGAGGMGEVYRARDMKLGRDVAIKVLPDLFANDPDRLGRFHREAQVLASLNHPNVAHIHGVEESNTVRALVMELVEGPTLADRISNGPIPLAEALPIARQIADALEAAHERGVIHRDLKPANIKVRDDDTVKILDFGLARLGAPEPSGAAAALSQSPTLTTPAMTEAGVILGTAAYMAPEQARGKVVDRRADIWAFGCVLYEMLAGTRAFTGDGVSDTIAHVLMTEPDWTRLPAGTPASIRRLLGRCLEKDPRRRLRDIGDVRLELDDISSGSAAALIATPAATRSHSRERLAWFVAAILAVVQGATLLWFRFSKPLANVPPIARTAIVLPANQQLASGSGAYPLAVSPDGSRLVYVAEADGRPQLYLRELASLEPKALPGTAGATHPFFSPDGQWVAFFAAGALQKVALAGSAPLRMCTSTISIRCGQLMGCGSRSGATEI